MGMRQELRQQIGGPGAASFIAWHLTAQGLRPLNWSDRGGPLGPARGRLLHASRVPGTWLGK